MRHQQTRQNSSVTKARPANIVSLGRGAIVELRGVIHVLCSIAGRSHVGAPLVSAVIPLFFFSRLVSTADNWVVQRRASQSICNSKSFAS